MKCILFVVILIFHWPVYDFNFEPSISGLASEETLKSKESDSVSRNNAPSKYCRKPAVCEKLKNSTCYGVKLPYASTSITHVPDVESQEDVQVSHSTNVSPITRVCFANNGENFRKNYSSGKD